MKSLRGVHNPVLWDLRLSILQSLGDQVTFRVVFPDHLDHEVRADPVAILAARIVGSLKQHEVRLAKLARPEAQMARRPTVSRRPKNHW